MKTIRENTFETNSSSTHSVTILDSFEFRKWFNNELYLNSDTNKLITIQEACDILRQDYDYEGEADFYKMEEFISKVWDKSDVPLSYDNFESYSNLETDVTTFTSKSGDELTILCQYGFDN